jgi:hypothetical protein
MKSHVADNIVFGIRKKMVLSDLGYTPQRLVPLYVRNTLVESNGCTPGGDQTQKIMALDSRYTHTFGRPLNRFETLEDLNKSNNSKPLRAATTQQVSSKVVTSSTVVSVASSTPASTSLSRNDMKLLQKEKEDAKISGLNMSLVRLVFGKNRSNSSYYD